MRKSPTTIPVAMAMAMADFGCRDSGISKLITAVYKINRQDKTHAWPFKPRNGGVQMCDTTAPPEGGSSPCQCPEVPRRRWCRAWCAPREKHPSGMGVTKTREAPRKWGAEQKEQQKEEQSRPARQGNTQKSRICTHQGRPGGHGIARVCEVPCRAQGIW